MSESRFTAQAVRPEFARIAASSATVQERAAAILEQLQQIVVFDVGWLAFRDPERHTHVPVATTGDAAPLRDYFARPEADEDVDRLGLNRSRPPMLASEIPTPLSEVRAWADHLLPAGHRQGLAVGLFAADGRQVGFLSLLSADPSHPSSADRSVVAGIAAEIGIGLDRTRDIAETARIVEGASAGVVLTRSGGVVPLPGLPDDRMLAPGSPVLATAAVELSTSAPYTSFLAPSMRADGQLIRVTALDCARSDLDHLFAAVLLGPPGDLRGLAGLDLRVLGLLAHGVATSADIGRALHVAERAVVDSLGRCCAALGAADLTVATIRALRRGLRIPPGVM